jgi:hypothetical protein
VSRRMSGYTHYVWVKWPTAILLRPTGVVLTARNAAPSWAEHEVLGLDLRLPKNAHGTVPVPWSADHASF